MDARTVLQGAVFDLEAAVNFGADGVLRLVRARTSRIRYLGARFL